jgi:hypothetical protein
MLKKALYKIRANGDEEEVQLTFSKLLQFLTCITQDNIYPFGIARILTHAFADTDKSSWQPSVARVTDSVSDSVSE